jgi:hypothetical protein
MFVSERLIYIDLHKTGGSHIIKLLADCIEGEQIGKNNPLPPSLMDTGKYIVGSIRNPWDWYLSLWAFGCSGQGGFRKNVISRSSIKRQLSNIRSHPYGTFEKLCYEIGKPIKLWSESYSDSYNPKLFRQWLHLVFNRQRKHDFGEGYARSSISSFAGFLTYRYIRLHSKNPQSIYQKNYVRNISDLQEFDRENNLLDTIIRNENLEADLIESLKQAGYQLSDEQIAKIYSAKRTNTSGHSPTSYYYDQETSELVQYKERFIIDKYNYKSPHF